LAIHSSNLSPDHRIQSLERENAGLRRAVAELSILNDLANEIGRARNVDGITQTIIRSARRAVDAREGVITLVSDEAPDEMVTLVRTRAHPHQPERSNLRPTEALLRSMQRSRTPIVVNSGDHELRRKLSLLDASLQSLISVPLLIGGRLIGILTVYDRENSADFTHEDVRLLSIMAAQSAHAVEIARLDEERRQIIQTFGQYTSPEIVEDILRTGSQADGELRHVCVLFMDVRGFSRFAERTAPQAVVEYLSRLFEVAIDCINRNHGIVHQLLGDGLMAIFGAPVSYDRDCAYAVGASVEILEKIEGEVEAGRLPSMRIGIGLHAGEVVAGTIGTRVHREYKVTGDVVNVAARIEKLNKQFESRLLITEAVMNEAGELPVSAKPLGPVHLDGRDEAVHLFRLL
jgi:class 3 adenylate cyclase